MWCCLFDSHSHPVVRSSISCKQIVSVSTISSAKAYFASLFAFIVHCSKYSKCATVVSFVFQAVATAGVGVFPHELSAIASKTCDDKQKARSEIQVGSSM